MEKTALVLSAGSMFGAFQAGAWQELSTRFHPDLVVGASIGALNGWIIAARADPEQLTGMWLNLEEIARLRWRFPRHWRRGFLESAPVHRMTEDLHGRFRPVLPYGAVATRLPRLRPVLFHGPDLTWRHLAASSAVPVLQDIHKVGGSYYCDGGLLWALPVWAAAEMGATRVIALNAMKYAPSALKYSVGLLRTLSGFDPSLPPALEILTIEPSQRLGGWKEFLFWTRDNAERYIDLGREAAHRHSTSQMFCL